MRGRRKSLADLIRKPPRKSGREAMDEFAQWTGNQKAACLSIVVNGESRYREDPAKTKRVVIAEWLAAETDAMYREIESEPSKPVKSRRFSMAVRNLMRASSTSKKRSGRGRNKSAGDAGGGRSRADTLTGLPLGMEIGLVKDDDEIEHDAGLLSSDDELDPSARPPPPPPNHAPPNQRRPRPLSVGATPLGRDGAATTKAEARTSLRSGGDAMSAAATKTSAAAAQRATLDAVVADAVAAEGVLGEERRQSTAHARRTRRRSARWVATHDEQHGQHWFDLVSMSTVWTKPAGFDESGVAHWIAKLDPGGSGHFYYEDTQTGKTTWGPPHDLAVEIVHDTHWVLHYDPANEREYYFDVASGASSWHAPEEGFDPTSALAQWVGHPDPSHPGYYEYKHRTSGEVTREPPSKA